MQKLAERAQMKGEKMTEVAKRMQIEPTALAGVVGDQHDALTSLMAALARRDAGGASKEELSVLLRQLESDTQAHFRDEERYMRELAHPKLDIHQLIHRDLLAMLRRHVDEFETGTGRLGCKLLSFFKYWLGSHLEGMDCQITPRPSPRPEKAASGRPPRLRAGR